MIDSMVKVKIEVADKKFEFEGDTNLFKWTYKLFVLHLHQEKLQNRLMELDKELQMLKEEEQLSDGIDLEFNSETCQ